MSKVPSYSKVKVLVAYGTRYGATIGTAEEIARVFSSEGFDVDVIDVKRAKIRDISEYKLVIIGSGMQIDRWTREAEGFLRKFQRELSQRKTALFVSSGTQALIELEGIPERTRRARQKYLEEKAARYEVLPISMRVFGGVWDFNKMPWWSKKAMDEVKSKCNAARIPEAKLGVYDTRDWEDIRNWAKELVNQMREEVI